MDQEDPQSVGAGVKTPKNKPQGTSDSEITSMVLARWGALDGQASYWMQMWQTLSTFVMPRKSYILNKQIGPNVDRESQLFDTTAVRANQIMAAGIMSYVNDADSNWVQLTAPEGMDEDEGVEEYYAECSKIILQELARSNFYNTIHETHLDRGCFGTASVFVDSGESANLLFKTWDVGTFRISENNEGYVDTIFVKVEMTVRQMVEEYGLDKVSEKVRRMYELGDGKSMDEPLSVIQAIYPRKEGRDKNKKDGPNKPIASVHVEYGTKHLLRNAGFDEQPFFVTRFLKWQQSPYGWSPAWIALPDARQLNFLQKQMDSLAELAAFPRILVPEGMSGAPDLRAGGITYFDESDPNQMPKEWATQGRYDIGQDRITMKQKHIEDAFNVPLFQMFAQEDAQATSPITATQVRAMESEKLVMLSPTYSRLTTELLIPLIKRVYGILSRAGMMPSPPKALIQVGPTGDPESAYIPDPKVVFNNRMAIAVSTRAVDAIDPIIGGMLQTCQITQDMSPMDNFNFDEICRKKALIGGVDPEFLRDEQEIAGIRQQRAQAQQAAAQQQQQAHAAQVAQQLGSVPQDSPISPAIQKLAQQAQ